MGFQDEVSETLGALGAEEGEVADAIADPAFAARVLEGASAMLRVAPALSPGDTGYGPTPRLPLWLRFTRGSREVVAVPLRGGPSEAPSGGAKRVLLAERIELQETLGRCCDAASCAIEKRHTAAWIHLEGGDVPPSRLLVAEQRLVVGTMARAVHLVAHRLAGLLGVAVVRSDGSTVEADGATDADAEGALPDALGPLPPALLARFALRSEGDRVVLRDFVGRGPRASARRNVAIGVALAVVAALFWFELARALVAGEGGMAAVFGAIGVLFSLAAVAFLGVARFSARYHAESTALLALGLDRFIVMPWVGRTGAVDLRPEGRLGAAIPLGELTRSAAKLRRSAFVVELESDHGPIDALVTPHEAVARYWAQVVARVAAEACHPSAGASAKQRARARAAP